MSFKKAAQIAATSVFLLFFNSRVVFAEATSLTESVKNQTLTANRKIYAKVDGDEDFQLVHQDGATLTYDEKISIGNSQRKFTLDKKVSSEWPNYTMPKKEGYTALLTDETGQKEERLADGIIPKSEVTLTSLDNTNLDRNYYIIYYPDERTLSVEYIDKTTNEILSKGSYSGKSGEKVTLNIVNPDKNKYSIDNNIIPGSYTFISDSNQQAKIYLKDKSSSSKKEEKKRNKITGPNINLKENPKTDGSLPDTYLNDDDKAISLYTMPNRKKAVMKNKKNKRNSSFKKAELNFNQCSLIVLGTVIIISSFFICKIKLKPEV